MNHHLPRILPLLALLALLALSVLPASAAPRLTCKQPTFDFGTRDTSEVVDHTFVLENSGTADLVITAIRTACGCTAANLTRQTIPPGESAELSTRLTLAGRPGDLHKTILVESNDPANPAQQLALAGKAAADFEIQPSILVLRKDSPSKPASGFVQIRATNGSPFKITNLASASGDITLRADPLPGENAYQISANFDLNPPPGEHPDQITLSTNFKGGRTTTIGALIMVPAPISVAPSKIVLEENPYSSVSRTIILKAPQKEKIEIASIETPDPEITTQVQALGDFGVRVTLNNITPKRELDSKPVFLRLVSGQVVELPFHIKTLP
jgi:hypothetical protein